MKIKSIEFVGYEDVYNMEVEDHHNFIVDGGSVLHNCDAIRYFCAGRPKSQKIEEKINRVFNFSRERPKPSALGNGMKERVI